MNALLKKPVRRTAAEETVDKIRDLILIGRLGPGEPLRQDELSAQLGVSRTPLREAIIRLQEQGLVVNHPHRGAVVFKPTAEEMREIYELRGVLEARLVRNAVSKLSKADLDHLESLIDRMETVRTRLEFHSLNNEFHMHIYARAGEPITIEILKMLRDKAAPYILMSLLGSGAMQAKKESNQKDHRELLAALRAGDAALAEALTVEHLGQTTAFHRASLEEDIGTVPALPPLPRAPAEAKPRRRRVQEPVEA